MDKNTAIVAASVCIVALGFLLVFRGRLKFFFNFFGLFKAKIKGENPSGRSSPGVRLEGAESSEGRIKVDDQTGRGAHVEDVSAKGDIDVSSKAAPGGAPPKPPPPISK